MTHYRNESPHGFDSVTNQSTQDFSDTYSNIVATQNSPGERLGTMRKLPEATEYTVKSGDTVWDISTDVLRKQLGREPDGAEISETVRRIAAASGLANADLIFPDDKLTIPPLTDFAEPSVEPSDQEPAPEEVPPTVPEQNDVPQHNAGDRSSWYISQQGDDQLRSDGWFGCGPTSLLMGLAAWGVMDPTEANRRQLIQETGTLAAGQFPGDVRLISSWAQKKGLQSDYSLSRPDISGMDTAIAEGKSLIVNGSMLGRDGKTAYAHFVYIAGKDANGNYILGDPAQSNVTTWNRNQLYAFVTRGSNPPGYAILWR